ncbi:hypothetical protein BSU04_04390 [Caballeronia sordidicola]|uniref:Uncharacterized protein n=1 Tax=Caballeronia sordidicola TaxID=196367 RepID=A0A226X985_CABSO|nr:hypothetical protein BSU04_04390 [Caballeronia sordidicola]
MRFPGPFVSIGKATQNPWIPLAVRRRASCRTKPATHLKPLPRGSLLPIRIYPRDCCSAIKHPHRV